MADELLVYSQCRLSSGFFVPVILENRIIDKKLIKDFKLLCLLLFLLCYEFFRHSFNTHFEFLSLFLVQNMSIYFQYSSNYHSAFSKEIQKNDGKINITKNFFSNPV